MGLWRRMSVAYKVRLVCPRTAVRLRICRGPRQAEPVLSGIRGPDRVSRRQQSGYTIDQLYP